MKSTQDVPCCRHILDFSVTEQMLNGRSGATSLHTSSKPIWIDWIYIGIVADVQF